VNSDRGGTTRLATLRAALGFLQLSPRAPELRLLHLWLDSWTGLGLVVVGVPHGHRRVAGVLHEPPAGLAGRLRRGQNAVGRAVQIAAWAAVKG
jgi:hypothetical protein